MESLLLVGGVAFVALATVILVLRRPQPADPQIGQLIQSQSELTGRLAQMAAQATAAQTAVDSRLAKQEAALSKVLTDGLQQTTTATQKVIADLNTRLGAIAEAQKSL